MAFGKWIGAILGFTMGGGVLGALAGYAIGSLFDSDDDISGVNDDYEQPRNNNRNEFLFSLMVLSAHIIKADGKIMHSEMEYVRQFLRQNFGEAAVQQGESILLRLFDYHKQQGNAVWNQQISQVYSEIAYGMPEEHRLQLLAFLSEIAKADGRVDSTELTALKEIAAGIGLNTAVVDQMLAAGGKTLDEAYAVLGMSPDSTDDELRKAYRKMALQYHPDRVATLGEDVKKAAEKKFQEINDAKDRIWKARGL